MRPLLLCLALAACAGPSRKELAETPTATTRRPPSLAPPASNSDEDRYQVNQQFEDMRDAEQAHREVEQDRAAPPPEPLPQQPDAGTPPATPAEPP
jgi:hypothetical protein